MSDIEDALSKLNRLNRSLSTVHQDIASTLHTDLMNTISAIDQLSVVLVGSVVVALDDLVSVQLSTIHPDLSILDYDLASVLHVDLSTLDYDISSILHTDLQSTIDNLQSTVTTLESVLHPDLEDLTGRIGDVSTADTLNYLVKDLSENRIGNISTSNTLIERINDLSVNRIGNVDTEDTLNWLLDKIRGVERWYAKKVIDLMSLWEITTTNESFPCFIGNTDRVIFRNFYNGTDNIGQIIVPLNLISPVWNTPSGYTTDVRGFAWDGNNLWVMLYDSLTNLKICRVVDYTASPWSFDKEYNAPTNDCKGLIYRSGKLITYDYGTGTAPFDFYEVDPSTGTSTYLWSTDTSIGNTPGGITYDSDNDWILLIQPVGYGGLYALDSTTGETKADLSEIGTMSGSQLYGVFYHDVDKTIWTDDGTKWRQIVSLNSIIVSLTGLDSTKTVRDVLVNNEGKFKIADVGDTALQDVGVTDSIAYILKTGGIKVTSTTNPPNLDVALSTRASETTLSNIKTKTDNLDVLLSTRLADSTFTGRFPSAVTLSDSIANPTVSLIGAPLLGWESSGAVWKRLQCDDSGRLKVCFD